MDAEQEEKQENMLENMSCDKLPVEILEEIFEFLEPADLLNSTLVCKRWKEIVGKSSKIMKRIPLYLTNVTKEKAADILELDQSFYKIVMKTTDFDENLLKVFQKHGSEVRELFCSDMNFIVNPSYAASFGHFLSNLPKLEKLTLEEVRFDKDFNFTADIIQAGLCTQMDTLKSIVLNETHPNILKMINAPKILSLKQCYFSFPFIAASFPYLQELAIHRTSDLIQPEMEADACPLKRFSISIPNEELTLSLLQNSKDTIEQLEIIKGSYLPVLQYVFTKLPSLKFLKIDLDQCFATYDLAAQNPQLAGAFKPNISIRTLVAYAKEDRSDRLQHLIGNLPNLETFVLDYDLNDDNSMMTFISNNLPKLQTLEVHRLRPHCFDNVVIPSLKRLHIHDFSLIEGGLILVAVACPNLETLVLENYNVYDDSELTEGLQHLPKLKNLHIGEYFIASREFFRVLLLHCPELESLTLMKSALEDDPTAIDEFKGSIRRLIILKHGLNMRVDFDVWASEDVRPNYLDDEDEFDDDLTDLDDDIDEVDEFDDDFDGDNISDDEFVGMFRPG